MFKNVSWNEELEMAAVGADEYLELAALPPRMCAWQKVGSVATSCEHGCCANICAAAFAAAFSVFHAVLHMR